ncbi:hypothetical protein NITMOv2_2122 [Nitrospira moscoviensis]|uniref:Uncharacterized protein n=1 Tax=Nitrospira moscoviensis TaxID=42253 RepID=A0A0K2GCF7_NITMO|nr:hypothetical protein NITMOv2_2122 [Nitrospira moscoviensis]
MTFADWLSVGLLGSALGVPLLYAVRTLLGLRHKTVYPLLRARSADGRSQPYIRFAQTAPPHAQGRSIW